MNPYIVLSVTGLWLIYGIIIKVTKKRKYDYSFVVAFVFLLGWMYFQFLGSVDDSIFTIYMYVNIGLFAFWLIIDNSILLFKKNVSEFDFYNLEKDLEHVSASSEILRQRFISTIELLHDGISFRDQDIVFGTDRFLEITGRKENEFSFESYLNSIHKDDLVQYKMKLEKLSKKYPTYAIKYRVKKGDKFVWILEKGKVLFIDKKPSYISTIKPMDVKRYPETDVDVLNNLEDYRKLREEMQRLQRKKVTYHFVLIQLSNIPKINEKYGRDFGDLMMGEYLSKLRFKFIKDNHSLYRISGIKFGLIIKEKMKFDLLDRALVGNGELLNLKLQFGGVTQTIFPNIGISESPYEGKDVEKVLTEARDALRLTLSDDFGSSFCFYDRI
jgi:GGDEF domain-containing protein/PAS domain-containing protein